MADSSTSVKMAVLRSMPDTTRPRLSDEAEAKFADVDQKSAACYAEMEELTQSLRDLAKQVDAVPEPVADFDDISTVNHIEDLRIRAVSGEMKPLPRATTADGE